MKQKNLNLIQQLLSGLLFVAVLVMLGWLSVRYNVKQDWTYNKRNTLTAASQKQLASMADPVRFVAFAYPGSPERDSVQFFYDQYHRFKNNAELEFVDPSSQPQKVKDYKVSFAGEMVLEYQGRRENLRALSEQAITAALQRLSYSGDKWVVFLEGHGERPVLESQDQNAYTAFAEVLKDKGLKVQPLNLIKSTSIPDNTAVLVIASPQSALLEGEVQLIDAYVKKGGNLLWLTDPDHPAGMQAVADDLGIAWQQGFAVFPNYELLGLGHPGIFAALDYPPNPVTQGMQQVTLFPLVRSLSARKDKGWNVQAMLTSGPDSWLETQPISDDPVSMDVRGGDIPGPLDIGMTLTREVPDADDGADAAEGKIGGQPEQPDAAAAKKKTHQQRIALIGDADFLSNANLGQLGNQQLGLNLVQWLASRDAQLDIDVPKAPDTDLFLPSWAVVLIGAGFVIVLPLLLIGTGVTRWIVRRRR